MTYTGAHHLASPTRSKAAVPLYLGLTFVWAWALWGYWVVAMPPGGLQISAGFLACAILGGFAPSLAALAVTATAGRGEIGHQLIRPLFLWKVERSALAVAVLLAPAAALVSLVLQASLIGPLHWPDASLLTVALIWPLLAAVGEELGWRGFLLPRLELRFGLLPAALLIGVVWGMWHLPAHYISMKGYGDWFWAAFLLNGPIVLTAHSIIMAWLWRRTSGSLFAAILYHATITGSAIVAPTSGSDGLPGVLAAGTGAAVLWAAALLLVVIRREDFTSNAARERNDTAAARERGGGRLA